MGLSCPKFGASWPKSAPSCSKLVPRWSFWGHLGVTLGSFWGHFAHSWVTLRSLWVYEVYFGIILVRFQKTFIFPNDINDFMQLLGHLGETLGPIFEEIMEDTGRKFKNGPQKWHVDAEWHV